jgi:uncharacterized MAPEG superfamily protein
MSGVNPEVVALTWVSLLTAFMWMPYVVARMFTLGVWGVFDYPPKQAEPPAPPAWADRARRAHTNAIENLVLFAALVMAVELSGGGDASTAIAAWTYLGARGAHWVLYSAGIPVLRTLSFCVGWACQLALAAYILL